MVSILAWALPGTHIDGIVGAAWTTLALMVINKTITPLLLILTLPVTFLTLGLFLIFFNTIILMIVDYIVESLAFDGFWSAFVFSMFLAWMTAWFTPKKSTDEEED